jgi:ParB family chromosome partitioning protein
MTQKQAQSLRSLATNTDFSGQVKKNNSFHVSPDLLVIKPDFNARDQFVPDYYEQPHVKAHIRKIADSYKAGNYVDPIVVQVIDNEVCVRSGHCRTRALRLAISEGAEIQSIKVNEHSGDEAAQQLLTVTSNDGLPITPLAVAVVYQRLSTYGFTDQQIASKVGKTVEHVRQTLALLNLPIELKQMIQRDQISSTYASELVEEFGTEEAVKLAKEVLAQPTSNPKKKQKVTKSKISSGPRISRSLVNSLHSSFMSLSSAITEAKKDGENYLVELSSDQMLALQKLQGEIEQNKPKTATPPDDQVPSESDSKDHTEDQPHEDQQTAAHC